jgi:ribosomal protein S18 acetylase RimI-like enzyme
VDEAKFWASQCVHACPMAVTLNQTHSGSLSIRLLSDADLVNADAILKAAFGGAGSRIGDLQFYRRIQPDGWFLAFQHARPVGMVGATNYKAFAHVGFMAVHPEAQRQGIGLALMQHVLAWLDQQGLPLVVLDASKAGQPLYEKLGFAAYDDTLVVQCSGHMPATERPPQVQTVSAQELDELIRGDTAVFGADRGRVLQALWQTSPERALLLRNELGQVTGYLFAQKGRIGPWVMHQAEGAEALLRAASALPYAGGVSVTVPAENLEAVALLKRYGFEKVRTNRHMSRGSGPLPGQREKVYGQTSLAVG